MTVTTLLFVVLLGTIAASLVVLVGLGRRTTRQWRSGAIMGLVLAVFFSCELIRALYFLAYLLVHRTGGPGLAWLLAGVAVALIGYKGRSAFRSLGARLGFTEASGIGLSAGLLTTGFLACLIGLFFLLRKNC